MSQFPPDVSQTSSVSLHCKRDSVKPAGLLWLVCLPSTCFINILSSRLRSRSVNSLCDSVHRLFVVTLCTDPVSVCALDICDNEDFPSMIIETETKDEWMIYKKCSSPSAAHEFHHIRGEIILLHFIYYVVILMFQISQVQFSLSHSDTKQETHTHTHVLLSETFNPTTWTTFLLRWDSQRQVGEQWGNTLQSVMSFMTSAWLICYSLLYLTLIVLLIPDESDSGVQCSDLQNSSWGWSSLQLWLHRTAHLEHISPLLQHNTHDQYQASDTEQFCQEVSGPQWPRVLNQDQSEVYSPTTAHL